MGAPIDSGAIDARQSAYLVNHYLTTHITAVSVALGMAGLSAATLLGPTSIASGYLLLFWVLWGTSLLATATAYSGTMIGAVLLPVRVPAVVDLILPLALATSEFLLFGLLTHTVTGLAPSSAVAFWWFALASFSGTTFGILRRASRLIESGRYSANVYKDVVTPYLTRQKYDIRFVSGLFAWSALNGVFQLLYERLRLDAELSRATVSLVLAMPLPLAFGLALRILGKTASELRSNLDDSRTNMGIAENSSP